MQPHVYIDMRCLQDPRPAGRGIGTHARNLLRAAREVSDFARAARLVALTDPALPALPTEVAALADEVRRTGYVPEVPAGALLLQLSPMAMPPLFVARLLQDRRVRAASVVYDFIPLDEPDTHLDSTAARLVYHTQLAWLRRYRLFLPISQGTATRLETLVPAARRVVVTGAGFEPWATCTQAAPEQHVLVVGGPDPRKNVECAIRAHAGSTTLQRARLPLIVTGAYPAEWRHRLLALAARHGGDPALLRLPGYVDRAALAVLYHGALCVAVPSRAEGFSLPVVEALAAQVPALVSDISVHAELVADPALRFPPEDDARLTTLLEQMAAQPTARAAAVQAGADLWPRYTAAAVAERAWTALAALAAPQAPPMLKRRPRLAFISPLPPARSGIADHSVALLRALAPLAEVTAVPHEAATGFHYATTRYDRVMAVMGNGPSHHRRIYELLRQYGGACICHDARLLQFFFEGFGPQAAREAATAELGRVVTDAEIRNWLEDETTRQATLLGPLAEVAAPLILHAAAGAARLRVRFSASARYLPFAVYREPPPEALTAAARTAARDRLGFSDDAIHIVSLGFIGAAKGLKPGIEALAALRGRGVPALLHWVGFAAEPLAPWRALAEQLGVGQAVLFHDRFVDEATYRDFLLAADLALQLRLAGRGNISGALQDCVAAGLPAVADDDLKENLEAPAYIRPVASAGDPELIATALDEMIHAGWHRQRDEAARAAYCAHHGMDSYARALLAALNL